MRMFVGSLNICGIFYLSNKRDCIWLDGIMKTQNGSQKNVRFVKTNSFLTVEFTSFARANARASGSTSLALDQQRNSTKRSMVIGKDMFQDFFTTTVGSETN